jgi:protein involved in polysaccharide export with SLBB domain
MIRLLRALVALLFVVLQAVQPALAQGGPVSPPPGGGQRVAAEQRLSVGDVLQVLMPGEDAFTAPLKIDRDGNLDLPEVGLVEVAGLSMAQARERVRTALSASFRDLGRFNLLLKERRLPLSVLGLVKQPGQIELPAGSNVQMAINAAGGLAPGAQLDKMQVRRATPNGTQVLGFDYKHYLDSGDTHILPSLRPLDEIFVPASPLIGNVQIDLDARSLQTTGDAGEGREGVRVFGEVMTPGSFAYKPGMTTMDALLRAGGVTRYAGVENVRVISGNKPELFNLKAFLDTGNPALNTPIQAGTTIYVPIESPDVKSGARVVYVMGEVAKPGAFEARPGTSFIDILANAGGPTRFADSKQIRIIRARGSVDNFDLAAYTENPAHQPPPLIEPGDAIFVPEKLANNEQATWLRSPPNRVIRVVGAVRNPGRVDWSDEMSLIDLIAEVGGPSERGDITNVSIVTSDSGGRALRFNLKQFLEHGGPAGSLPQLRGGYTVTVPELPQSPSDMRAQWTQLSADRSIYIMGAVGHPGRYAFDSQGLSFLDILAAADGPSASADILNIRVAHRGEARDRVTPVNLAQYFETGDDQLLPHVRPGDVIFVPDRNRNWLEESPAHTIRLLGAVNKAGRYRFTDGMTILDLLAEAGGMTKDAYEEKIIVVNLSCCQNEARVFDLPKFAKTGDFAMLPVIRAGDTVYVPNQSQSDWTIFMDNIRDSVSVLSILALLKVLL